MKCIAEGALGEGQMRGLFPAHSSLSQRSGCAHMIMWGGGRNLRPLTACLPVSHHSFIGGAGGDAYAIVYMEASHENINAFV